MSAMLTLPRAIGLRFELPPGPPIRCETCRKARPSTPDGYCSTLCRLFDASLAELRDAIAAADGDRDAPAVVLARTQLRAVAAVFDDREGLASADGPIAAASWAEDVDDGLLLPIPYPVAIAEVRRIVSA